MSVGGGFTRAVALLIAWARFFIISHSGRKNAGREGIFGREMWLPHVGHWSKLVVGEEEENGGSLMEELKWILKAKHGQSARLGKIARRA